jgi:lysozyme family protein
MFMSENFDYAVKETLNLEGGYSNNPNDTGGETNFGITHVTLKNAYDMGIVNYTDVKQLTVEDAKKIYKRLYWDVIRLDEVKDKRIAATLFDICVNGGPGAAGRIVQYALTYMGETLDVDGKIGPTTMGLINKWCIKRPMFLFIAINCEKYILYKKIIEKNPTQQEFALGWLKRIQQWCN